IAMFVNTALAGIAAGIALMLLAVDRRWSLIAAGVLGVIVAGIGAATMFEHATGIDLRIDNIVAQQPWGIRGAVAPGRMGPPASISFALLGTAMVLLNAGPRCRRAAVLVGLATLTIAMLSLTGRLFRAEALFS